MDLFTDVAFTLELEQRGHMYKLRLFLQYLHSSHCSSLYIYAVLWLL